jgi:hypothetical protein
MGTRTPTTDRVGHVRFVVKRVQGFTIPASIESVNNQQETDRGYCRHLRWEIYVGTNTPFTRLGGEVLAIPPTAWWSAVVVASTLLPAAETELLYAALRVSSVLFTIFWIANDHTEPLDGQLSVYNLGLNWFDYSLEQKL